MPITVKCPHDNAELDYIPDKKTGFYLKCPKCGCTFRFCLAVHDGACYRKRFGEPKTKAKKSVFPVEDSKITKKMSEEKKVEWIGGPNQEITEG